MFRSTFLYDTVLASPAPTSTTFALAKARRFPSGTFVGRIAYCISGTGAGQSASVTASAVGTGLITVVPSLGVTFDATSVIELWPEGLDPAQVDDSLNMAVRDAQEIVNVRQDITSPTLDSTYKIVTLPPTFVKIIDVQYLDAGSNWTPFAYARYPNVLTEMQRGFTVRNGSLYLSEPIPSSVLGPSIVVRGYRLPGMLTGDADLCEINPAFLTYMAAYLIEAGESYGPSVDPEQHSGRAANWLRNALTIRESMGTNWEPGTQELEV